jgi:hypothetical protein
MNDNMRSPRPLRMILSVVLGVALSSTTPSAAGSPLLSGDQVDQQRGGTRVDGVPRVRSSDSRVIRLIAEGVDRSPTFRQLVDDIDASNLIVYVEFGICSFGRIRGCLVPGLGGSAADRYLRVIVINDRNLANDDRLVALIGHELQHVRELLGHGDLRNTNDMKAVLSQIGWKIPGEQGYETDGARRAGAAVLRELTSAPRIARK